MLCDAWPNKTSTWFLMDLGNGKKKKNHPTRVIHVGQNEILIFFCMVKKTLLPPHPMIFINYTYAIQTQPACFQMPPHWSPWKQHIQTPQSLLFPSMLGYSNLFLSPMCVNLISAIAIKWDKKSSNGLIRFANISFCNSGTLLWSSKENNTPN